ncbi:C40 family peptidase [bacterium]|nr:C40 family peptidase [bacterium]
MKYLVFTPILTGMTIRCGIAKLIFSIVLLICVGCSRHRLPGYEPVSQTVAPMGFCIQVGAFAIQKNAIRFTERLRKRELDAYYFIAEDKLYKVRFGNYSTLIEARTVADKLKTEVFFTDYFVVQPEGSDSMKSVKSIPELRRKLIRTTQRFLGCSYQYGGTTEDGFDCSGLVMTIYRLNGLDLPRIARDQYKSGRRVALSQLQVGDLVFFRTGAGKDITHVGIYIDQNQFIHAPGKGKTVGVATLSDKYLLIGMQVPGIVWINFSLTQQNTW